LVNGRGPKASECMKVKNAWEAAKVRGKKHVRKDCEKVLQGKLTT